MKNIIGPLMLMAVAFSLAECATFSYNAQGEWPGICVVGNTGRQSPINIVTSQVRRTSRIGRLHFNSAFSHGIRGEFENTCQNVEFTPDASVNAVVDTPAGRYKVEQFHFHWGRKNGEGSEHLVNGKAEEFEIHFVCKKIGHVNPGAGDANAVISVRGEASRHHSIRGTFDKLDVSRVIKVHSSIRVRDIVMGDLLPSNRDYYYYEGSLTTPNCDETVQWFVLKHRIQVPYEYLEWLRMVEMDDQGNRLTFNYRRPQLLGARVVYTPASHEEGDRSGDSRRGESSDNDRGESSENDRGDSQLYNGDGYGKYYGRGYFPLHNKYYSYEEDSRSKYGRGYIALHKYDSEEDSRSKSRSGDSRSKSKSGDSRKSSDIQNEYGRGYIALHKYNDEEDSRSKSKSGDSRSEYGRGYIALHKYNDEEDSRSKSKSGDSGSKTERGYMADWLKYFEGDGRSKSNSRSESKSDDSKSGRGYIALHKYNGEEDSRSKSKLGDSGSKTERGYMANWLKYNNKGYGRRYYPLYRYNNGRYGDVYRYNNGRYGDDKSKSGDSRSYS